MQAVILAAGKGKRIQSITRQRSKAMLPILGKPIIERSIEHFASNGVTDFIIVITTRDRTTPRYFQRESQLNVDIRFVYQEEQLGTANALNCAIPLIEGDFYLAACDNLTAPDHITRMNMIWDSQPGLNGLLTLMEIDHDQAGSSGIVTLQGDKILTIIEKPSREEAISNIASIPIYRFSCEILEFLPRITVSKRGEFEIQSAIQMLIDQKGGVNGVFVDSRISITNPADLLAANQHFLLSGYENPQVQPQIIGQHTQLISPLYIERGTIIGTDCVIGPNVYIERDCQIGDNVSLHDCVLLKEAKVQSGSKLEDTIIS